MGFSKKQRPILAEKVQTWPNNIISMGLHKGELSQFQITTVGTNSHEMFCLNYFSKCFQIETHHQSSSRLDTPKGGVWLALIQRESSQSFQKEPESSLNHHHLSSSFYISTSPSSINITMIWRQKRRQEWSPKWSRGNGHKDYVLVGYLNVVFGWGEHSANVFISTRLPDIE